MNAKTTTQCNICHRPADWIHFDGRYTAAYCRAHQPIAPPKEETMASRGYADIFTRKALTEQYQKHVIEDGQTILWLAKNNALKETSEMTMRKYLLKFGLHPPAEPEPPAAANPTSVATTNGTPAVAHQVAEKPLTNQLQAIQNLMATLDTYNVAITGRATIQLNIEIDIGSQT